MAEIDEHFIYVMGYNKGFKDGIKGSIPKSVLEDIKAEIETDLSMFCFDLWGNENSTWTEIKAIIDKHMESEDDK